MDATDTQKRAFLKFKDTIRQMGESNSMYQPFDKIPYDKTKKYPMKKLNEIAIVINIIVKKLKRLFLVK